MATVQEAGCPPDQLEVDAVTAFFFTRERPVDGAAGLLDRRLGQCLTQHLQTSDAEQGMTRLLVKGGVNIAASWVLFYPAGDIVPEEDSALVELLGKVLSVCIQSGFRRIAIAPPVEAGLAKKHWLDSLNKAMKKLGEQVPECLVTFDESYLHDHSVPVLNI